MLRVFLLIFGLYLTFLPTFADASAKSRALSAAVDASENKDWARAQGLAQQAGGQSAQDIVTWFRLRDGQGSVAEVLRFVSRNGDWPGMALLRKRMEPTIAMGSNRDILTFYQAAAPQTGTGVLSYAKALRAAGRSAEAEKQVIDAWLTLPLKDAEFAQLIANHDRALRRHHQARLDMALWKGWQQNSNAMLPYVTDGWRKLAKARLGLRQKVDGVDALIAAVPSQLKNDPGLAYERFRWRVSKGRHADAIKLLEERSKAKSLGNPDAWARSRRDLARRVMRDGAPAQAYRIASQHGLSDGSSYADLEWIAGFVSLRFQGNARRARGHFQNFEKAVFTPISLGRAGYWIGRAEEKLGNAQAARQAYAKAARYQTSYYGLLAAERAGIPFDATLAGKERPGNWRNAGFNRSSVFQAGVLLINAGQLDLGERFLRHLAETLPSNEVALLGDMLIRSNQPHIAVMVGKEAAKRGITIPAPYYALHPLTKMRLPVADEMALAIARRESEFDPTVTSHAGAQGLMQVMPATAKRVAKSIGITHQQSKMLTDWKYNVTLGSAYLRQMSERFNGNVVMVSAAYNAGPGRPESWMERFGDPRKGGIDIVDWVELIPFNETRNYVMRVTESLPVYRARSGQNPLPRKFSDELRGSTLAPFAR